MDRGHANLGSEMLKIHGVLQELRNRYASTTQTVGTLLEELRNIRAQRLQEEIEQGHRLHASTVRQVENLKEELGNLREMVQLGTNVSDRRLADSGKVSLQRILLFISRKASIALSTGHAELSRRPVTVCAGKSFMQVVTTSKTSDCTLGDVRVLIRATTRIPTVKCTILPCKYQAVHSSESRFKRIGIEFDSFRDMCDFLQLNATNREQGLYRERRSYSQEFRSSQIMGIRLKTKDGVNPPAQRILIGRGALTLDCNGSTYFLEQNPSTWSERSWDSSFSLCRGTVSDAMNDFSIPGNSLCLKFALIWSRCEDYRPTPSHTDEMVLGSIFAQFPVVILRSRTLTESAREIVDGDGPGLQLRNAVTEKWFVSEIFRRPNSLWPSCRPNFYPSIQLQP